MRRCFVLALLLFGCADRLRDLRGIPNPDPHAWPDDTVAVLIEHDPWGMVIGADTPRTAVFRDGTIIRLNQSKLFVSQVTGSERDRLLRAIEPSAFFWLLRNEYNVMPNVTDQVTTELVVSEPKHWKRVQVYGYSPDRWESLASTTFRGGPRADALPREVKRLGDLLASLKPQHEVEWQPRYLEVMLWPYEYSPESPLPWPSEWPNLKSPSAFARGDSWSIILDGSQRATLEAIIATRGERQAIALDGHKWAIAWRPVMPGGHLARDIAARLTKRSS